MEQLTLRSKYPGSLRPIIEGALTALLQDTENGIQRTRERLQEFETKYQLSTEEFLRRFEENDELEHSLDFDEWIGESRMLESLLEEREQLKDIQKPGNFRETGLLRHRK